MNTRRRVLRGHAVVAMGLAVAVLVAGCGSSDSNGASGDDKAITVAYSNPRGGNSYLDPLQDAMEKTVEAAGGKFVAIDAKADPNKQISDIQILIAKDPDILVVYPLDPRALGPVLKQATDRGIKLVGFNADITKPAGEAPDAPYVGQVYDGFISQELADRQVKWIGDNVQQGKLLYSGFALPVPSLEHAAELVLAGLKTLPGIEYVGRVDAKTDDTDAAVAPISAALTKNPDIAVIICYSDANALGAYAAVKAAGKEGLIRIVSSQMQDPGVDAIKDGAIDVTYDFQNVLLGKTLGEMAMAVGAGSNPESYETTVAPPLLEYTKANIESYVGWEENLAALN